ncbi:MAG: hypothetical protein LAO08_20160 [Acidobacteriia bacterium]|nr:hypothetical protein [Terriglobia bacterium]
MPVETIHRLPHATLSEWIQHGYLWKEERCQVKGCGLPYLKIYWPNDPAYQVDPQTMKPHAAVCGDPARVAAMIREEDSRSQPAPDGKTAATGERR